MLLDGVLAKSVSQTRYELLPFVRVVLEDLKTVQGLDFVLGDALLHDSVRTIGSVEVLRLLHQVVLCLPVQTLDRRCWPSWLLRALLQLDLTLPLLLDRLAVLVLVGDFGDFLSIRAR